MIVGVFVILAAASAIGFGLMFSRLGGDACLDGFGEGASCPTLAVVNGQRYQVAIATALEVGEGDLTPYGPISQTNRSEGFSELTAYRVGDIDPSAVLVARAAAGDGAPYRLLFGPNEDEAFPALCDYIPLEQRQADTRCGAPA